MGFDFLSNPKNMPHVRGTLCNCFVYCSSLPITYPPSPNIYTKYILMVGRCVFMCQLSRQEQLVAYYTFDVDDGLVPDTWHGRHDVSKSM